MMSTNAITQDELREKLDEYNETLLGHLGLRDVQDNWWGHDTNVGTLEQEIETTLDLSMKAIEAYKDNACKKAFDDGYKMGVEFGKSVGKTAERSNLNKRGDE